eukprot:UC1_evm3s269
MTSGFIAQLIASPTDLVKVQMQLEGKRQLQGLAPRYAGTVDAFATIARQHGIRGLWKGWGPNCQRAALVNLGELTTYDTAKRFFLLRLQWSDNSFTHTASSLCAGLVAACFGTPADVIKTRVMNQPVGADGRGTLYRGSFDCLKKTVSAEGIASLWKGFLPSWARMAPWSLVFWLTFERVRTAANVEPF